MIRAMVESPPETKVGEQFPLLLVNGGEGDNGGRKPSVGASVLWNVSTSHPQRPWIDRWPELVSTCWMTLILLAISFLVFYAIGMVAYKRQSFIVVKCNNSDAASGVYFHHLVQRNEKTPFKVYSEYLATMAVQYPMLTINVIFLVDDSYSGSFPPRHSRMYSKILPYRSNRIFDENNKREIREFQKVYQNANVTITPLSKYMSTTPLKYKWRNIPTMYLPFFARISTVWQNGGVGMDLTAFNNQYGSRQRLDRKISAILKQHNNGINPEDYAKAINLIERDEKIEFTMMALNLIRHFFNETLLFLNYPLYVKERPSTNDTLRVKRNFTEESNKNETSIEIIKTTNNVSTTEVIKLQAINNSVDSTDKSTKSVNNSIIAINENKTNNVNDITHLLNNMSAMPEIILFYDFSIATGELKPPQVWPDTIKLTGIQETDKLESRNSIKRSNDKYPKQPTQVLSIDSQGTFVSAALPLHPFLGQIISGGCERMCPNIVIQDALLTQCSGIFINETYCKNIFLL